MTARIGRGWGGEATDTKHPRPSGWKGVPKSTLPDIGENRGPALRTDQTPNSISRSRSSLFAILPPLTLASLRKNAKPDPPRHHRHLHHPRRGRQPPTLKTPPSREHPIFLQMSREHEGEKNVRERLVANDRIDPETRSRRSSIWESPD